MNHRSYSGQAMRMALILCSAVIVAVAIGAYFLMQEQPPSSPLTPPTLAPAAGPATANSARLTPTQTSPAPQASLPLYPFPPDPIPLLLGHDNSPSPESATATVNGEPCPADYFQSLLISVVGPRVLDEIINLTLAEQDCAKSGIDITSAAFQQNLQAELDRTFTDLGAASLPPASRPAALQQFLASRGTSEIEFHIGLRLSACLRAVANGHITVTDDMLRNAFNSQYGPRLHGRVFVVRTRQDASVIRAAIVEQNRDIDEVAALCNARPIILPLDADIEGLQKLRDASISLAEKQISPIVTQPDGNFSLFYLDTREPANLAVDFDVVKDQLRPLVFDQAERTWAANHLLELRRAASIRINDPLLAQLYRQIQDQLTPATRPASTQPASPGH